MIKLGTKKTISIKIIKYFGNYLLKIVHLVYGCLQKKDAVSRVFRGTASVLIS